MIAEAKYRAGIETSQRILKKLNLLAEYNRFAKYDDAAMKQLRRQAYEQIWRGCLKSRLYTFLLNDQSFFQFRRSADTFSYAFYDCPFEHLTIEEFAREYFGVVDPRHLHEIADDYENYLLSVETPRCVAPMRFDFDPLGYRTGTHPAAHLHIGHMTNIRVATDKVLHPHSFVLLVIRQMYPLTWEQYLTDNKKNLGRIETIIRSGLDSVSDEYRKAADKCEMILM